MHFFTYHWTVFFKKSKKKNISQKKYKKKLRNLRKFKKIKTVNLQIRIELKKILSLHKNIYIFDTWIFLII